MNYRILVHPELKSYLSNPVFNKFIIFFVNIYLKLVYNAVPVLRGLKTRFYEIAGYENRIFKVEVFEPEDCKEPLPCVFFIHGGGFGYRAAGHHKKIAMFYAKELHCKVVMPDYHLIPKYKYPAAFKDVVSAYRFVVNNAEDLMIDSSKIGIIGDSAGGMLAALLANDYDSASLAKPCFQLLVYPVCGLNLETDSMKNYSDAPVWNNETNKSMWNLYFKDRKIDYSASPMHKEILSSVPETYIEVAEFDILHDEGVQYAEKLQKAGVKVELNQTKGTFHGYDCAINASVTKENIQKRIAFMKRNLLQ